MVIAFKECTFDHRVYRQYTGENMDAEGMVGLLNYRVCQSLSSLCQSLINSHFIQEDGVTRMFHSKSSFSFSLVDFFISILHILERWPQRGETLIVYDSL